MSFLAELIVFINLFSFPTWAEEIKIKVNGLKNSTGNLEFALYDQESFPSDDRAKSKLTFPLSSFKNEAIFKDVKPGTYAIVIFHDENLNKQLDKNVFHIPTEGYGLSQNPKIFGPPQFSKASFELRVKETKELNIEINY